MDIQKEIEVYNRHHTRKRLDEVDEALGNVIRVVENYQQAFPTCEEHKPNGGVRTECLECHIIKLTHALSRISYLCGEPNEMQVSEYDTHCDADLVVNSVKERLEGAKNLHNALTTSTWLLRNIKSHVHMYPDQRNIVANQIDANEVTMKGNG
jgi:hypothetical protein